MTDSRFYNNSKIFSFLGMTSQQEFSDLVAWEIFFQRSKRLNSFVELGTGRGGMSLYFLLMALQRSFRFKTYDVDIPEVLATRLGVDLEFEKYFHKMDVLDRDNVQIIGKGIISPVCFYCDNGKKPFEVELYSGFLEPGDYLAVHDFDIEIFAPDIPETFLPFIEDVTVRLGSRTRFFEVRE